MTSPSNWLDEIISPLKSLWAEVFAFSFFINILAFASPIFVLQVYDRVVYSGGLSTLYALVLGMVIVVGFDFILRQARSRLMQKASLRIDVLLGRKLFAKFSSLPLRNLESRPSQFWQLLFQDVDNIRNTLSGPAAVLIVDLPFAVLFLALIFVIAPQLGWAVLCFLPLFLLLAARTGSIIQHRSQTERKFSGSRDILIAELIAARTTVKALGLGESFKPLWEEKAASAIEQAILRGGVNDRQANIGIELAALVSVVMTTVGALFILKQELSIGALVAANMLSGKLLGPLNQLVGSWRNFTGFRQSWERLSGVFAEVGEKPRSEVEFQVSKGILRLENVSFSYPEAQAPAIDKINLEVHPGGMVGVVGKNGCGKSTLLKLILGLYAPQSGRILLDGADIAQLGRADFARLIGYVPQDCVLFNGNIRDNIAIRNPRAEDAAVLEAARNSGVHAQIVDLPQGYGTSVGEVGARLSGGQRQRIVMARALLGDPPILLLDEPSSNLDRAAEEDLRAHLLEISKARTVLMVTHSPLLLSATRAIMILERGRIIGYGPSKDVWPKLFGNPKTESKIDSPA